MMTMPEAIKFSHLVDMVKQPQVGKRHKLSIRSGTCRAADVAKVMYIWGIPDNDMPYCIWEYVSEILFQHNQRPVQDTLHLLQRGRVFGKAGDMILWRQGEEFAWRFIGQQGRFHQRVVGKQSRNRRDSTIRAIAKGIDFWQYEPGATFHRYGDKQVMLWGEWSEQAGQWFDDRVARAKLTYPIAHIPPPQRVLLQYDTFSRNGVVEFVWFKRLVAWPGGKQ